MVSLHIWWAAPGPHQLACWLDPGNGSIHASNPIHGLKAHSWPTWRAMQQQQLLLWSQQGRLLHSQRPLLRGRRPRLPSKDAWIPGLDPFDHLPVDLFLAQQLQEAAGGVLVHPKLPLRRVRAGKGRPCSMRALIASAKGQPPGVLRCGRCPLTAAPQMGAGWERAAVQATSVSAWCLFRTCCQRPASFNGGLHCRPAILPAPSSTAAMKSM